MAIGSVHNVIPALEIRKPEFFHDPYIRSHSFGVHAMISRCRPLLIRQILKRMVHLLKFDLRVSSSANTATATPVFTVNVFSSHGNPGGCYTRPPPPPFCMKLRLDLFREPHMCTISAKPVGRMESVFNIDVCKNNNQLTSSPFPAATPWIGKLTPARASRFPSSFSP